MNTLSRRALMRGGLAVFAALAVPSIAVASEAPSPDSPEFPAYVMDRIDDMHRGRSSQVAMSMTVKTEHWTRTMSMEAWSKGKDYSLVRILAPKKEKGTATLKSGEDLFTYLAKTGRTVKISGAMMGGAWMGSHVTNNDLVKAARLAENYDIALTNKGTLQGIPQYVFTLTPHEDAPVVWGKIEVTIRQHDLLPTRQIFFDEDGEPVRAIQFQDYADVGGRTVAKTMVVRPLDDSGEYTKITYDSMKFDVDLPSSMFTIAHLKSL